MDDLEIQRLRREIMADLEKNKPLPIRTPEEIRACCVILNREARERVIKRDPRDEKSYPLFSDGFSIWEDKQITVIDKEGFIELRNESTSRFLFKKDKEVT